MFIPNIIDVCCRAKAATRCAPVCSARRCRISFRYGCFAVGWLTISPAGCRTYPQVRDYEPVIGETVFLGQPHTKRRFDVILLTPETKSDWEEMAWLAGQGVGFVYDIRQAAEIVNDMMLGAADILRDCHRRLG